jgi:glyoxylase-like metal-dependent hydrolase (beta-lactamase superfamily II)
VNVTEVPNTWDARVRMFRAGDEVDCFVVITDRYAVVIDTFSTPEDAAQMMELVRPELENRQLLVVNTHQHYDHVWGNSLFAAGKEFAAPILANTHSRELLSPHVVQLMVKQMQEERFANVELLDPSLYFFGGFAIEGGDLSLDLIPAPGHSPDQVVVWIAELSILLAADALEFPFPYAADRADLPVLLQTMRMLQTLKPKIILPCHGGIHNTSLIDHNLAYFTLLEQHASETARDLPPEWWDLEDLPERIGFSFEDALKSLGLEPASVDVTYQEFHEKHPRLTI